MASDTWRPGQYDRFADERRQPFHDLLALLEPVPDGRVADLGCGTGALTRIVHERLGARETIGVDSSAAMLARAPADAPPGLRFVHGDLRDIGTGGPFDVVFSNAALHWVPEHAALFAHLVGMLAPGGQLAVQMPANHDHPSHTVARAVAQEPPFRDALDGGVRPTAVLLPEEYALLLDRLGLRPLHVRLQVYLHHLAGPEEVVEWTKGTLLTDYEKRLGPALFAAFLERYRAALLRAVGDARPYPFTFKRILLRGRLA